MKLLDVSPTPAGDKKKFVATFTLDNGKRKLVKFGIKGSRSFVDGAPSPLEMLTELDTPETLGRESQ